MDFATRPLGIQGTGFGMGGSGTRDGRLAFLTKPKATYCVPLLFTVFMGVIDFRETFPSLLLSAFFPAVWHFLLVVGENRVFQETPRQPSRPS